MKLAIFGAQFSTCLLLLARYKNELCPTTDVNIALTLPPSIVRVQQVLVVGRTDDVRQVDVEQALTFHVVAL